MKKLNIGLKEGILIDITILLISALLLLGFTLLKISEHILVRQHTQIAKAHISSIQNSIAYAYQINRGQSLFDLIKNPAIQRLLKVYTEESQFNSITIVNREMSILYSSELLPSPNKPDINTFRTSVWQGNTEVRIKKKGLLFWFLDKESSLEIYSPIYFGNEVKAGIIGKVSLSDIKLELTKMRGLAFVFAALDAIVFIIFGWFLLSRGVLKPVKKLIKATEDISKGTFSYKVEMGEYREINTLAKSFNLMAERLEEKTDNLNRTINELKQINIELQTAQESLIRSEKLATTGRLAAGLAHEIGNPLGSITNYIDYLLKDKKLAEKNKDCLVRVENEVGRIDTIIHEFLNLASPSRGIITSVNIKKTISDIVILLKHRKEFKDIIIEMKMPDDLPQLKFDEQKLQQVLFNILLNAADAVNENAEIIITGEILESDEKVLLSILDNGKGIESKDLSRIFDPFFTTKEPGKGTGLGLSICQKIITDAGGEIIIESIAGAGTKVKIFLPWQH